MDKYDIGYRAAKAIRERAKANRTSVLRECKRIDISNANIYNWEKFGKHPSTPVLQQLCFAGYDVIYILTGEKKDVKD